REHAARIASYAIFGDCQLDFGTDSVPPTVERFVVARAGAVRVPTGALQGHSSANRGCKATAPCRSNDRWRRKRPGVAGNVGVRRPQRTFRRLSARPAEILRKRRHLRDAIYGTGGLADGQPRGDGARASL